MSGIKAVTKVVMTITEDPKDTARVNVRFEFFPNNQAVGEHPAMRGAVNAVIELVKNKFNANHETRETHEKGDA